MALNNVDKFVTPCENVYRIAQQISFVKQLAENSKKLRDVAVRKLRKYLTLKSKGSIRFTEDDFLRIWKGLFYCMWMSDKPLVQEDLAEKISHLVHCFQESEEDAINFIQAFFSSMCVEWFGIDQHRLDKFMMLVRRFLRQTFMYCGQRQWNETVVHDLTNVFKTTVLLTCDSVKMKTHFGLTLHFIEIFLEELAKVGQEQLPEGTMLNFLQLFIEYLSQQEDVRLRTHVVQHIFHYLMKQSDQGIEYEEKFAAWKQAGFPGENCEDMERVEIASELDDSNLNEEIETDIKDPRAGKVNVVLPQLQFNADIVADLMLECSKKCPLLKNRKTLQSLAKKFQQFSEGKYPLAFKLSISDELIRKKGKHKGQVIRAVKHLQKFEHELARLDKTPDIIENEKRKLEVEYVKEQEDIPSKKQKIGKEKVKGVKKMAKGEIDSESNRNRILGCNIQECSVLLHNCLAKNEDGSRKSMNGMKRKETDMVCGSRTGFALRNCSVHLQDCLSEQHDKVEELVGEPKINGKVPNKRKKRQNHSCMNQFGASLSIIGKESIKGLKKRNAPNITLHKTTATSKFSIRKSAITIRNKHSPSSRRRCFFTKWEISDICNSENKRPFKTVLSPKDEKSVDDLTVPDTTMVLTRATSKFSQGNVSQKNIEVSSVMSKQHPRKRVAANGKKVNIDLQMNKEQKMSDYKMALKQSPCIPFDASKRPTQGVLKPSPMSSPINPFFRISQMKL